MLETTDTWAVKLRAVGHWHRMCCGLAGISEHSVHFHEIVSNMPLDSCAVCIIVLHENYLENTCDCCEWFKTNNYVDNAY